jgi:hypothetical protein
MYVIYGLEDKRVPEIFYVGMTDNVYARFAQHIQCDGSNPAKDARILDMKANNVMTGMVELQRVGGFDLARARESYWIQHYYQLGAPITNQVIPLVQNEPVALSPAQIRLGPRMTLDEQRFYVRQLADTGISHPAIYAMVEKYIPREMVRFLLREYAVVNAPRADVPPEDRLYHRTTQVLEAMASGINTKDGIIERVWRVKKGKGQGYQEAGFEYEQVMRTISNMARKGMELEDA